MNRKAFAKVVLVGPVYARGGIASVVQAVLGSRVLDRMFDISIINTSLYKDGSLLKNAIVFLIAIVRMVYLSIAGCGVCLAHIHASAGRSFYRKIPFVLIARMCGMKVVFHIHASGFDGFYVNNKRLVERRLVQWLLKSCDNVALLSEKWREMLAKEVALKCAVVVRNPSVLSGSEDVRCKNSAIATDQGKRILFMGFLVKRKGIYDLLEAFALVLEKIRTAELIICGKGEEESRLRKAILDRRMERNVRLVGWVDGRRKCEYMLMADVFVFPSYSEGMPMVLLEALSIGRPVVATRVGGIPEFIESGVNGFLIEPGDVVGLADAILKLLEDKKLRSYMETNNRILSRKFSPDVIAKSWHEMYTRTLGLGSRKLDGLGTCEKGQSY